MGGVRKHGWDRGRYSRVGVSTVFIFRLFWGAPFLGVAAGGGGVQDFKGYVNVALNVGTKGGWGGGVESFRGSGSECNSLALTEKRG